VCVSLYTKIDIIIDIPKYCKKNPPNFFGGLTETLRRSVLGSYQGEVIFFLFLS